MCTPRKNLSGAEYRKRAKDTVEQGKLIANKMKKCFRGRAKPSDPAATSDDTEILEYINISCNLYDQDEGSSTTIPKQSISQHLTKQPSSSTSNE